MSNREKFGKFVLLEQLETSGLGSEFRAAKLGPQGLEKIVSVLRLSPGLSANVETAKRLMDEVKVAAQLQNPNIVRIFGIGKVDALYYVSYEFIEGKSLRAIFDRGRRDAFPFSVDHGLLIASKICSALEYSHGRKTDAGTRYFHGLLNPGNVVVSYEGEVRVRGFGHWLARVREAGALRDEDVLYLSPEQAAGGPGETRSDVFAVGAVLYETLTGQPLFQGGRSGDVSDRLAAARLQSPSSDDDKIPKPIAQILARALAQEPSARYAEIQEMRKGIDTLLFSGDFTPTTFNLAFFMHSLFRDDIDHESKQIKDEREASYAEFLTEAAVKTGGAAVMIAATPIPSTTPVPRPAATPAPRETPHAREAHASPPTPPAHAELFTLPMGVPAVTAREAAASFTFHKEPPRPQRPFRPLCRLRRSRLWRVSRSWRRSSRSSKRRGQLRSRRPRTKRQPGSRRRRRPAGARWTPQSCRRRRKTQRRGRASNRRGNSRRSGGSSRRRKRPKRRVSPRSSAGRRSRRGPRKRRAWPLPRRRRPQRCRRRRQRP